MDLHIAKPTQPLDPAARADPIQKYLPKELTARLQAARATHAMQGERRVITVLFCDIQGSTGLAERLDPEEWTEIMNGAFECLIRPIYRYEGTLARLMGDAILAFFGAPIAHEDDPQRAVLAGLEILSDFQPYKQRTHQERGLQLNVRVGINTGLVVVGEVGSDLRVEYTAMGDAVNLAARMEQTAAPGTIQVAEDTYRRVSALFDFESLGALSVKGKSSPVMAYRALAKRPGVVQLRGIQGLHSPLVGREADLQRLIAVIDRLVEGHGQVVSIQGEAGIGKSRLLSELRAEVTNRFLQPPGWHEGRCLSYDASTPFSPWIDFFESVLGLQADERVADRYLHLVSRLQELGPDTGVQQAPFLAALLGIQPGGEDYEQIRYLEPPLLRIKIFAAVAAVLRAMAARRPLVVVIDDLHWADVTSIELLESLLPLADQLAIFFLTLFRPNRQDRTWEYHELASRQMPHRYTTISLEPLNERQARQLVANLLLIEDLPESVRSLILGKAEGNPFFVEEVIRSLLDANLIVQENGHWRALQEIENIPVPDTLAGVITTRLDRLDDSARRTAQTAAVIGRTFSYDILTVLNHAPDELDVCLLELRRRELIREKEGISRREFIFKHTLTQETAYNSLLLSQRRALHTRAAAYLEQTESPPVNEIARHWLEARQFSKAMPFMLAAGAQAARAYSTVEAAGYFRKAVELLSAVDDSGYARQAYEGLGSVLTFSNDFDGAIQAYQDMLESGRIHQDNAMQVSALNKLSHVLGGQLGQYPEADQHLRQSEELARQHADLPGMAELYMVRCEMCTSVADFEGAVEYLSEAVEIGRRLQLKDQLAFGLTHIANTLLFMTRFDDAWQTAQEGLEVAREIGNRMHIADLLTGPVGYYHLRCGNLEAARQATSEGVDIAAQIGAAFSESCGCWLLGEIARMQGDYLPAIEWYQRGIRAGKAVEPFMPAFSVMNYGGLGLAYLESGAGSIAQVQEVHARALKLMDHPAGIVGAAVAWADIGMCLLSIGERQQAGEFFSNGLDRPTPFMLLQRPRLLVGAARLALEIDHLEEAGQLLLEAENFVAERGMKYLQPLVWVYQGQLLAASSLLEAAVERFAQAETLGLEMGLLPLVLQAVRGSAKALRAAGNEELALEKEYQANELFIQLGTGVLPDGS